MTALRTLGLGAALAVVGAAYGDAGSVVVRASIPFSGLNWTKSLALPQFDASLGALESVEVSFKGAARGTIQLENTDSEAADYLARVSYVLKLSKPSGAELLTVQPNGEVQGGNLDAYDGALDYGGASGISYPQTSASAAGTVTISGADLAAFVGAGVVSFPVRAQSNSDVATPGNFDTLILNEAAADIEVTYRYSFTPAPALGSIGDRVWFDSNANGKQDDGELGAANLGVKLLDATNRVLKTTATDALGNYLFGDLPAGDYRVQFSKPTGYGYTAAAVGTDAAIDSDANADGLGSLVALGAGQDRLDVDAGLVGSLCLGDRVWKDLNKNGLQDSCEPGVPGVAVHLLDASGAAVANAVTDANGLYRFVGLAPGDYTVDFDAPAGYGFTKPFADSRYKPSDSNVDPETGLATVTLASSDTTIDAGLVGALKIGDTVWLDSDGDGRYEPEVGEKGLKGVHVFYIGDTNNDGRVDVWGATTTDADGRYRFIGLAPGLYQVAVSPFDLPYGARATYDLDGAGTKNVATARLLANVDNLDFDFGYKPGSTCGTGNHGWWGCNPSKWSCDWIWIGGKCHSKTTSCYWMKKADCGDKSILLYQRLCAAKLNVGNGCSQGAVFTCGKVTCSVKDAIKRCDDWMRANPVGCKVSGSGSNWAGICDYYGILDRFCR